MPAVNDIYQQATTFLKITSLSNTNDINKIRILLKKHLCHNINYIRLLS